MNPAMTIHYIFFFFLLSSSIARGGANPEENGCDRCCQPNDPISKLTASVYTPITVITCLIMLYVMNTLCSIDDPSFRRKIPIDSHKNIRFPDQGVYHGYFSKPNWNIMHSITIAFIDGEIKGSGVDSVGEYEWYGDYKSIPILLKKKYKLGTGSPKDNFGHEVKIELYPIHLTGDDNPSFYGNYYVQRNKSIGLWFMVPINLPCNIKTFFPNVYSKWKVAAFIILVAWTIISIVFWIVKLSSYEFVNNLYPNNIIRGQIEGAISAFALILILIFNRRFHYTIIGESCKRKFRKIMWCFFYFSVALICLIFGALKMVSADFLQNQVLYNKDSYINGPQDFHKGFYAYSRIANICEFDKYDCSVIWTAEFLFI